MLLKIIDVISIFLILISSQLNWAFEFNYYRDLPLRIAVCLVLAIPVTLAIRRGLRQLFRHFLREAGSESVFTSLAISTPALLLLGFFIHPNGLNVLGNNSERILTDSFVDTGWHLESASSRSGSTIALKSPNGKQVSLIAFDFQAEENRKLKVSFEAKSEIPPDGKYPFYLDLYGAQYDRAEHDLHIAPSQLTRDFKKFEHELNTGNSPPTRVQLRFASMSANAVEIRNVKLLRLHGHDTWPVFRDIVGLTVIFLIMIFTLAAWRGDAVDPENNRSLWGYGTLVIGTLMYTLSHASYPIFHDASGYWLAGKAYVKDGAFSLLHYDNALRGYFFPLFNLGLQQLGAAFHIDSLIIFRICAAFFFPFFFYTMIPNFLQRLGLSSLGVGRRMAFYTFVFIFWKGYFITPLTDFFALFLVISSLYLLNNDKKHGTRAALGFLLAGFAMAAATNMRPSYLAVLPVLAAYLVFLFLRAHLPKKILALRILFFFIGVFILLGPQSMINKTHFNSASPMVQQDYYIKQDKRGADVLSSKFRGGMHIQRYETYVGSEFSYPAIIFRDPGGLRILIDEGFNEAMFSGISDYLKIVRKYPWAIIKIYLKHLFNGLDTQFDTGYIATFYTPVRYLYATVNYILWFLCGLTILKLRLWSGIFNSPKRLNILLVLVIPTVPIALALPGEPEIRFFLPLYLICYGMLSFSDISIRLVTESRRRLTRYAVSLFLFVSICHYISSTTFANIHKF